MIKDTSAQDTSVKPPAKTRRIALWLFVVCLIAGLSTYALLTRNSAKQSVSIESITIARVETGDLIRELPASGTVVATKAPLLYAPEQGFVNLQVIAGDSVVKNQVVAVMESPELQNQFKQEQAELERLKGVLARQQLDIRRQELELLKAVDLAGVNLQAANREFRRADQSIAADLISKIDHEKAIDDLSRAKLHFEHAQQEAALAKDTLAFEAASTQSTVERQQLVVDELTRKLAQLEIKASVHGLVGNLLVQPRALVNKNAPLMTLVDLSGYEVELLVQESYANELSPGIPVEVQLGNQSFEAMLASISPEISNRQVTTRVRFVDDQLPELRQNQQVSAKIILDKRTGVLKVKRGAFTQAGGFTAFRMEGSIARKVPIKLGVSSLLEIEIVEGLKPDDQIIISSYNRFADEDSVFVRQ